jgi:hypothetical protein
MPKGIHNSYFQPWFLGFSQSILNCLASEVIEHVKAGQRSFIPVCKPMREIQIHEGVCGELHSRVSHFRDALSFKVRKWNISLVDYIKRRRKWICAVQRLVALNGEPWVAF